MKRNVDLSDNDLETIVRLLDRAIAKQERSERNRELRGDAPDWWEPGQVTHKRWRDLRDRLARARG